MSSCILAYDSRRDLELLTLWTRSPFRARTGAFQLLKWLSGDHIHCPFMVQKHGHCCHPFHLIDGFQLSLQGRGFMPSGKDRTFNRPRINAQFKAYGRSCCLHHVIRSHCWCTRLCRKKKQVNLRNYGVGLEIFAFLFWACIHCYSVPNEPEVWPISITKEISNSIAETGHSHFL